MPEISALCLLQCELQLMCSFVPFAWCLFEISKTTQQLIINNYKYAHMSLKIRCVCVVCSFVPFAWCLFDREEIKTNINTLVHTYMLQHNKCMHIRMSSYITSTYLYNRMALPVKPLIEEAREIACAVSLQYVPKLIGFNRTFCIALKVYIIEGHKDARPRLAISWLIAHRQNIRAT